MLSLKPLIRGEAGEIVAKRIKFQSDPLKELSVVGYVIRFHLGKRFLECLLQSGIHQCGGGFAPVGGFNRDVNQHLMGIPDLHG